MGLADFAEKPTSFELSDKLSKVISKLYSEKAYEGFVFDRGQFIGIISAKDILKKSVTEPEKAKLSSLLGVIKRIKAFEEKAELKDIISHFLINNSRCVPIERDGEILSLSKLNLLNIVSSDALKGKTASDLMFFPECVSSYDTISVVKSSLRTSNAYRMAVMGKEGKIEGIIDDVDLLNSFSGKPRNSRGGKIGEKVGEGDATLTSHVLMKDSYISVSPATELKYVIKSMLDKKQDSVAVEEDGKLLGLITPREILKLVGADIGGVYVNITGIHDEDDFIQGVVNAELRNSIKKLGKVIHIHYMTLNIKRKVGGKSADYKIKTKRTNYTLIGRIVSNKGSFFAEDNGWDLAKCTQCTLKKLEKEVYKKVSKDRTFERSEDSEYGNSL